MRMLTVKAAAKRANVGEATVWRMLADGRLKAGCWRRVRDSNPRWRFCRPLPYHLANSPRKANRLVYKSAAAATACAIRKEVTDLLRPGCIGST